MTTLCENKDGHVMVVEMLTGRFIRWATDDEADRHRRLCEQDETPVSELPALTRPMDTLLEPPR